MLLVGWRMVSGGAKWPIFQHAHFHFLQKFLFALTSHPAHTTATPAYCYVWLCLRYTVMLLLLYSLFRCWFEVKFRGDFQHPYLQPFTDALSSTAHLTIPMPSLNSALRVSTMCFNWLSWIVLLRVWELTQGRKLTLRRQGRDQMILVESIQLHSGMQTKYCTHCSTRLTPCTIQWC